MKRVLNVGSGGEASQMPPWFDGWEVVRLDIDPACEPDWLLDARDLLKKPYLGPTELSKPFDAVFCSHNLEHYTPHDAGLVVAGMRSVLMDDGFVDAYVPNVGAILRLAGKREWDLDTFIYQSPAGPILLRDMLYGYSAHIEYAEDPTWNMHKNGFSARTLSLLFTCCGFWPPYLRESDTDIRACAFKRKPSVEQLAAVGFVLEEGEG